MTLGGGMPPSLCGPPLSLARLTCAPPFALSNTPSCSPSPHSPRYTTTPTARPNTRPDRVSRPRLDTRPDSLAFDTAPRSTRQHHLAYCFRTHGSRTSWRRQIRAAGGGNAAPKIHPEAKEVRPRNQTAKRAAASHGRGTRSCSIRSWPARRGRFRCRRRRSARAHSLPARLAGLGNDPAACVQPRRLCPRPHCQHHSRQACRPRCRPDQRARAKLPTTEGG